MKRIVSLLLVLVLLLSALPFAGAFSDDASIDDGFKKAVAAMSEKKIIGGFTDGSFKPSETLTRAQAAKILCVMLEGAEKADALTKTETGFADVPATHWAAKYVAYCVDKGIVAGVGEGKFDPDGQLSSGAFAKMLLVAYGEDGAKFTGGEWLKNVQDAVKPTLLAFNLKEFGNTAMPRQEAAQLGFNAMYAAEAKAAKTEKDITGELPTSVPEKITVLAIGNSFSNDSVLGYLCPMLQEAGVKEFTVGNLYHGGCSLEMHTGYALKGEKAYQYYKRTEKAKKWNSPKKKSATIDDPLKDLQWDYITFQQASARSGLPSSFQPWEEALLYYVQSQQPKAVFGWNMTWAYGSNYKKAAFKNYDNDQMKMYNAITKTAQDNLAAEPRLKFLIPVGTAIQNARTSFLGDNLNRDGTHLNKGIGRYIASLTWCCKLTGVDPDKITYLPETLVQDKKDYKIEGLDMSAPGLLEALGKVARESVKNALAKPFEITQSQYTTAP